MLDGFLTGKENMSKDLQLALNLNQNEAIIRFYRWKPYCISLGYNQKLSEINTELTKKDGIDIVHRPTGGRAILHSEELTYAVILPSAFELSPRQIYKKISQALIRGLILFDKKLSKFIEMEEHQPQFPIMLEQLDGAICFASTAKHEIKHRGKKIIGSAQRKLKNSILQHGTILVGKFHKKLPQYLNINNKLKISLSRDLEEKTTELKSILNYEIDYEKLSYCLVSGFKEEWKISIHI
jgi:lipoate-protein ligase A